MNADFNIAVDPNGSTVRIAMAGFFEQRDIARFVDAMKTAHGRLLCGANEHVTLVDIRGIMIQSQASVDAFAALLADPAFAARHIAFVVSVGLAHAQIRRAATGRNAHFSNSVDDAEAWLRQRSMGAYGSRRGTAHAPPAASAARTASAGMRT